MYNDWHAFARDLAQATASEAEQKPQVPGLTFVSFC
jgi:hypothetical protein